MNEGEIILYQSNDSSIQIDVRLEDETVWLTQAQMVELFDSTKQNVSLHINNVYNERELNQSSTVKEYLTVQSIGGNAIKQSQNRFLIIDKNRLPINRIVRNTIYLAKKW
jgi:hypothetical protein